MSYGLEKYSQWGEDQWIIANLKLPDNGVFVELGGADGISGSNTIAFEEKGWTGLLIEPNPVFRDDLIRNRPKAKLCFSAIHSTGAAEAKFYHSAGPMLSGLLPERGESSQVLPATTLKKALIESGIDHVDLLSIDTEGTEIDVWDSLGDFPKPDIVIIEWNTAGLPDRSSEIVERFTKDGYRLKCRSAGNLIFRLGRMKIQFGSGENILDDWVNTEISTVDITKPLPFPDSSVHAVYSSHVLEHVTPQQAWNFFAECHRILEPGGLFRVSVPSMVRIFREATEAYNQFNKSKGWADGTLASSVKSIIFNHGHQAVWDESSLSIMLICNGFSHVTAKRPGKSDYAEMRDLERHGRIIGEENNEIESICIEGMK